MDYRLAYEDPDAGLAVDLEFRATMPAVGHKRSEPPFGASAHFDQAGRVTGTVEFDGEASDVDCFALRDRSWGLRSERIAPDFSYCWMASAEETFLVYSDHGDGDTAEVTRGFLHRDGRTLPLAGGHRTELRDPERHWVERVSVHATDTAGRVIDATAHAASRLVHPRATSANTLSVLRWEQDGRLSCADAFATLAPRMAREFALCSGFLVTPLDSLASGEPADRAV